MNTEIIFIVEESPEGGYEARALNHSIFTEADTIDELKIMIKDAVHCHFEKEDRPKIIRLHYIKPKLSDSPFLEMFEWTRFQFVTIDWIPHKAKPIGLPISPHLRR